MICGGQRRAGYSRRPWQTASRAAAYLVTVTGSHAALSTSVGFGLCSLAVVMWHLQSVRFPTRAFVATCDP